MMHYGRGNLYDRMEGAILSVLRRYGLDGLLARDQTYEPVLWKSAKICMRHSRYGIACFEYDKEHLAFNPNVTMEIGFMLALGKRVLILKDHRLPDLPRNLVERTFQEFSSSQLEKDIDEAITKFLRDQGEVQVTETISGPTPLQSKKRRTERIIESLRGVAPRAVIRQAGSLSSLAISKDEADDESDDEMRELLIKEQRTMLAALDSGAILRCIISPDIQIVAVAQKIIPAGRIKTYVLPRINLLIDLLKRYRDQRNLQLVYAARLPHDNMLLVGGEMFIGRRRVHERGFPSTTIVRDPEILRIEIDQFDLLFGDTARIILGLNHCHERDYGSPELKDHVVTYLDRCRKKLRALASTHLSGTDIPSRRNVSSAMPARANAKVASAR
ncbi:MAG TPA: hypothetical protein VFP11_05860 [Candidatus Angelobacter sp.]|nr:hypothetical protein [Candidatus Angelobacter sp.]